MIESLSICTVYNMIVTTTNIMISTIEVTYLIVYRKSSDFWSVTAASAKTLAVCVFAIGLSSKVTKWVEIALFPKMPPTIVSY